MIRQFFAEHIIPILKNVVTVNFILAVGITYLYLFEYRNIIPNDFWNSWVLESFFKIQTVVIFTHCLLVLLVSRGGDDFRRLKPFHNPLIVSVSISIYYLVKSLI